jgi:hypothetical protein
MMAVSLRGRYAKAVMVDGKRSSFVHRHQRPAAQTHVEPRLMDELAAQQA